MADPSTYGYNRPWSRNQVLVRPQEASDDMITRADTDLVDSLDANEFDRANCLRFPQEAGDLLDAPFIFDGVDNGSGSFGEATSDTTPDLQFQVKSGATLQTVAIIAADGTTVIQAAAAYSTNPFNVSTTLTAGTTYIARCVGLDQDGVTARTVDFEFSIISDTFDRVYDL